MTAMPRGAALREPHPELEAPVPHLRPAGDEDRGERAGPRGGGRRGGGGRRRRRGLRRRRGVRVGPDLEREVGRGPGRPGRGGGGGGGPGAPPPALRSG